MNLSIPLSASRSTSAWMAPATSGFTFTFLGLEIYGSLGIVAPTMPELVINLDAS